MAINTTHSNNTIKTRIQLKSDTETNWKASVLESEGGTKLSGESFVPLEGELIIYTPDAGNPEAGIPSHPFSRLKIGDGITNVVQLPFVDAGTLDGKETEIVKLAHYSDRPRAGSSDKLYIDLETNRIYHYAPGSGYSQLSNFTYTPVKAQVKTLVDWKPGSMTNAKIMNNSLVLTNGTAPFLEWEWKYLVTDIQKEAVE